MDDGARTTVEVADMATEAEPLNADIGLHIEGVKVGEPLHFATVLFSKGW